MGIFSDKTVYTQKGMSYKKVKNSPVMKKILADKDIAKVLDEPREREEFYKTLKSKEAGGVTKDELREVFGEFQSGKGKFINPKEIREVAKKFFSSASDRYKYSSSWNCGTASKNNAAKMNADANRPVSNSSAPQNVNFAPRFNNFFRRSNNVIAATSSSKKANFQKFIRGGKSASFANINPANKNNSPTKSSFSQALRSTLFKK